MDEMEIIKEIPEWIKYDEKEDIYSVTTKEGVFILQEQTGEVVQSCEKMADKLKKSFEYLLIPRSSVEPKLTDASIKELKGSTLYKLKIAIIFVYGLNDLF